MALDDTEHQAQNCSLKRHILNSNLSPGKWNQTHPLGSKSLDTPTRRDVLPLKLWVSVLILHDEVCADMIFPKPRWTPLVPTLVFCTQGSSLQIFGGQAEREEATARWNACGLFKVPGFRLETDLDYELGFKLSSFGFQRQQAFRC